MADNLFEAAGSGDLVRVTQLLRDGEHPDQGDTWTGHCHDSGFNFVSCCFEGWTPLHAASEAGHEEIVKILLQHGSNVTNVTDTGYNPLHLAASGGHLSSCRLLVQAGSPLDEVTEAGLYGAPIHYAAGKVKL